MGDSHMKHAEIVSEAFACAQTVSCLFPCPLLLLISIPVKFYQSFFVVLAIFPPPACPLQCLPRWSVQHGGVSQRAGAEPARWNGNSTRADASKLAHSKWNEGGHSSSSFFQKNIYRYEKINNFSKFDMFSLS